MRLINFQDVLQRQTTPEANLGELTMTRDGRIFRYVRFNVSTVDQGELCISVATTTVTNITATSTNSAAQTVFIEETGAAWTVGQFQDAWGLVNTGTGAGQIFKIKDNTVDTLELYTDYRIRTALDTTSDLVLTRPNLVRLGTGGALLEDCKGVYQGYTQTVANDYGWIQTRGIGAVLMDSAGGGTVDEYVVPSNAVAGSVEGIANGETPDDVTFVGRLIVVAGAASQIGLAEITLL